MNIENYQYSLYLPQQRDYINFPQRTTTIYIKSQKSIFDTPNSKLIINGRIEAVGDVPLTEANINSIKLLPLHLYEQIKFYMCDKPFEYAEVVNSPGYSVLLKNLVLLNKTKLPYWFGGNILNKNGSFSVTIPLNKIFNMFEIYKKPIVRVNQTLELLRNIDDSNSLIVPAALKDKVKVNITDVFWNMPIITPSPEVEIEINKSIALNKATKIHFKNWVFQNPVVITAGVDTYTWCIGNTSKMPLYAIFAIQVDKDRNIEKDNTNFNYKNLRNIKIKLDDKEYPGINLGLNFENNEYGILYAFYEDFKRSYYNNIDPSLLEYLISYEEFANKLIIVIDLSHHVMTTKNVVSDIIAEFDFKNAVQANTRLYCMIVNDAIFSYNPLNNIVTKNY